MIRFSVGFVAVMVAIGVCAADYTLKTGVSDWTVADSYVENAVPPSNSRIIVPSGATVTLNWKSDSASLSKFTAQTEITVDGMLVIDGTPSSDTDALACPNLSGAGVVTNASPKVFILKFAMTGGTAFAGSIRGAIQPQVFAGVQHLTGTASTYSQLTKLRGGDRTPAKGVLGIAKFGKKGEPSSIGTLGIETQQGAGTLHYLGTGEETDKDIRVCGFWSSGSEDCGPVIVDAGAVGGLKFTGGSWCHTPGTGAAVHGIVLTGSNETASVIGNTFESLYGSGHYYPYHITKRGTGVWRMADTVKGHRAGFFVEEGRLQFDSIAEQGVDCSLGKSDILTTNYRSGWIDANVVDYAFTLGATDSLAFGTMEYLGSTLGKCLTRPFVLAGNGRLTGSATGILALSNVRGIGAGARTLALDGPASSTNHIANVTNGTAVVSVVKEGKGAWSMSGKLDFSGSLTVKDGLLTVYNRAPYTWYRFNGQKFAGASAATASIMEFALYDADGIRRNKDLTVVNTPDPYPASGSYVWHEDETFLIPTNGAGFGRASGYQYTVYDPAFKYGNLTDLRSMFKDVANGLKRQFETTMRNAAGSTIYPNPDDPSTWLRVVMRLSPETPSIVAFDLCRPYWSQTGYNNHFTHFTMEGSADGLSWEEVYATTDPQQPGPGADDAAANLIGYCWMSDSTRFVSGEVRKDKGYRFARTASPDGLTGVTAVSVEKDGRLEIVGEPLSVSNLIVSVSGVGTLSNVAFAKRGVMTVTGNVPREAADLGGTFENVTGLENLNGWTASCADRPNAKRKIEIVDGKIHIVPFGLNVIIR